MSVPAFAVVLSACAAVPDQKFPVSRSAQLEMIDERTEIIQVSAENISYFRTGVARTVTSPPATPVDLSYRLGVGDVIRIIVWDHPELTSPGGASADREGSLGLTVRPDGTIYFPYAGAVRARGQTTTGLQREISTRLGDVLPDPQVEVLVSAFNSQKVLVSGAVGQPGAVVLTDVPITLLEALSDRGGLSDRADDEKVTLERRGNLHALDLRAFLDQSDSRQNPILISGDVIRVPERGTKHAFILGQIGKPGLVDLTFEKVTLSEALALSGWLQGGRADARGVFVFREETARTLVAQFDLRDPGAVLLSNHFTVQPDDVIFVTMSPAGQWNALLSQLLPTVGAYRTVGPLSE